MKVGAIDFRQMYCIVCQSVIMGNGNCESLSNFTKHAKKTDDTHRKAMEASEDKQRKIHAMFKNQDHLARSCHCMSWSSGDSEMATRMIASAVCVGALPITIVENGCLRAVFEYVSGGKYSLPHRTKMRDHIEEHALDVFADVAEEVSKASGVSLTSDSWSANHKAFFAITASFLNDKFEMQQVVLGIHQFEESHGAAKMQQFLEKTIAACGIKPDCIVSLVGDAASSQQAAMRDAYRSMLPQSGQQSWCRCLAHMLQTAIRNALDSGRHGISSITSIIKDTKTVADVFGRSTIAHSALKKEVAAQHEQASRSGHAADVAAYRAYSVLVDCVTRWDGTLVLLRRTMRLRVPIKRALLELNGDKVGKSGEGLAAMHRLLQPDTQRLMSKVIALFEELHLITKADSR